MINLLYHEAKEKEEEIMKFGKEPDFKFHSMPEFSKRVFGLQRKKLVVIGARPSNGKTALALQWAYDLSKDHSVLFMSLESDTAELILRLFCNICQISNDDIREKGVEAYRNQWDWFCSSIKSRRLLLTDKKGSNWADVMNAIENDYKFDVIFLDYIQCVSQRGMSKLDFIEEYIKQLRVMAIEHNFCAVVLSQINRQSVEKDPKPSMTGLKNAGFLEEHADKCFLFHWGYHHTHDEADFNKFEVILAKNKMGKTGISLLRFNPECYRFEDYVKTARDFIPKEVSWDD